jgi:hypothetical protein
MNDKEVANASEPSTNPPQPEHPRRPRARLLGVVVAIVGAPYFLLRRLFGKGRTIDEIVVYSAPPAFYLWVVIAMGFGLSALVPTLVSEQVAAWIFITVLFYFLIAILHDLGLRKLVTVTLFIALLWLFARYMENLHHTVILGRILKHFADLNPHFDRGSIHVLCWLLLIPWCGAMLEMVLNRKKKFSPNEIAEFHFGEGSELTDRAGLRFVTKYRDVLETILGFGGGDLLAIDNHQTVIKRYENIVGLWFYWGKLDRILHQRATLVDDDDENESKKPTSTE